MRIRSLIALAAATLAALAITAPARAAVFTYSDPSCADFAVTGSTGNKQLVCLKLGCTISAAPAAPATTDAVTLTASCTPSATSYSWSLVGGAANCQAAFSTNASQPLAAAGQVRNCIYQVNATNGQLTGQATQQVAWGSGTGLLPPAGCSVTTSPANGQLASTGGAISMTGACSSGGAVATWGWQKAGATWGTSAAIQNDSLPANTGTAGVSTTYSAAACNATGCSAPMQAIFTVAGTGGGTAGFCSQYTNVTRIDTIPWQSGGGVMSTSVGGFADSGVFVAKIVVPAGATGPSGFTGQIPISEYQGGPTNRWVTVSTQACDFGEPGQGTPLYLNYGSTAYNIYFTVTGNGAYQLPKLAPGGTYYVNVRNWWYPSGPTTCGNPYCDAKIEIYP